MDTSAITRTLSNPDLLDALLQVERAISAGQLTPENPEVRVQLLDQLARLVTDLPDPPRISDSSAGRVANLLWYRSHSSQLNIDDLFIQALRDPEVAVRLTAADLLDTLTTLPARSKQPELIARVSTAIQQQMLVEQSPALAVQLSEILKKLSTKRNVKAPQKTKPPRNPYIAGLPIREGKDFYDRDIILQRIHNSFLGSGRRAIVYGGRRTGKTSLLCKLLDGYFGEGFLPVYLDLQACSGEPVGRFLAVLANAIRDAAMRQGPPRFPDAAPDEVTCEWLSKMLESLLENSEQRGIVLLLDEYEVLTDFFSDLATARQITALFDSQPRLFGVFAGQKLEAVGNAKNLGLLLDTAIRIEITFLEQDDARRLVTEPAANTLNFEEDSVQELYALCHGHPFYTQLLCQSIFDEKKGIGTVTVADVQSAANRFVMNATPHLLLSWSNDLNLPQRLVASVVAELREQGTVKGILAYLYQDRFPIRLTADEAYSALYFLQRIDWLKKAPRNLDRSYREAMKFEFTMDLLPRWIREYSPPRNLVEEQCEKVIALSASPGARLGAAAIDLLVILVLTSAAFFLHAPLWLPLILCGVYYGLTVIFCDGTPGMRLATRSHLSFASEVGQPLGLVRACFLALQIAIPSAMIAGGLWLSARGISKRWGIAFLTGGLALDALHHLVMRRDPQHRGIFDRLSGAVVIATKQRGELQ